MLNEKESEYKTYFIVCFTLLIMTIFMYEFRGSQERGKAYLKGRADGKSVGHMKGQADMAETVNELAKSFRIDSINVKRKSNSVTFNWYVSRR